jgi:hypothetical protein
MNCIEFAEKLHLTPLCEKDGEIEIKLFQTSSNSSYRSLLNSW